MHLYDPNNWEVVAKLYRLTADFRAINAKMLWITIQFHYLKNCSTELPGSGVAAMQWVIYQMLFMQSLWPASRPYTAVIAAGQQLHCCERLILIGDQN